MINWVLYDKPEDISQRIDHWVEIVKKELGEFPSFVAFYKQMNEAGNFKIFEDDEGRAMFAFMVIDDMRGGTAFCEAFMYILPEARGSLGLFKSMIKNVESYARKLGCQSIEIGANAGYRDEKTLDILRRFFGYKSYSVWKEL